MTSARYFRNDDAGYLRWLRDHPGGFVVNTMRGVSPSYMVLHRATCPSISEYPSGSEPGAFTERQYSKACGESVEDLSTWVRANGRPDGTFTSVACSHCRPAANL
jgi:hypothetical protein